MGGAKAPPIRTAYPADKNQSAYLFSAAYPAGKTALVYQFLGATLTL